MKVRIIQLLCPQRHAVMAVAYASDSGEADPQMPLALIDMARTSGINPWCGLCQSRDLHFEDGVTRWATMEEARPELAKMEAANAASRILYDQFQRKARNN